MRSLTGTPSAGYLGGSKLLELSVLYYKNGAEESMVIQGTVNPPPLARLVRSQDAPPNF